MTKTVNRRDNSVKTLQAGQSYSSEIRSSLKGEEMSVPEIKRFVCYSVAAVLVILSSVHGARSLAQTVDTQGEILKFEVASIKINRSGDERVSGGFLSGGYYRVTNYPLRALIAAAYMRPQINPDFLIAGGPEWMDSF